MKRLRIAVLFFVVVMTVSTVFSLPGSLADDVPAEAVDGETSVKTETMVSRSELDRLKKEWEAVREQQIQMIREKEDQLEKLKEDVFAIAKSQEAAASQSPVNCGAELEAQKVALQAERQKFFQETARQKENLQKLQTSLDEKARQLEAERQRFEAGKQTAA